VVTMNVLDWVMHHLAVHGWQLSNHAFTTYVTVPLTDVRVPVQVILRNHPTPGTVIRGFDLAQCSALWTGYIVYATALFALYVASGEWTCVKEWAVPCIHSG
jgi:hypothetical protein